MSQTILIADDDPVMTRLMEYNLRRAQFSVVVCREGRSVPDRARESRPSLAIFDLMLPGKSGLELIQEFRADSELGRIPLIVVTGQGKGSVKGELLEAGADSVFTKPFSPSVLIETIQRLTSLAEQASG